MESSRQQQERLPGCQRLQQGRRLSMPSPQSCVHVEMYYHYCRPFLTPERTTCGRELCLQFCRRWTSFQWLRGPGRCQRRHTARPTTNPMVPCRPLRWRGLRRWWRGCTWQMPSPTPSIWEVAAMQLSRQWTGLMQGLHRQAQAASSDLLPSSLQRHHLPALW